MDRVLRAGAGLMVTLTVAPTVFRRQLIERDFRAAPFYLDAVGDAGVLFPKPPDVPDVATRQRRSRLATAGVAEVDDLRFASSYLPANPVVRAHYRRGCRNDSVRVRMWRHGDQPRPTVIVLHGLVISPNFVNAAFFSMPWFYGRGYDVALVTLPFHGSRRSRFAPYSGSGMLSDGISGVVEGVAQGVHDVRELINYLESRGVEDVGVLGISLGGYLTALLAECEERLRFAIAVAPPANLATVMHAWAPAGRLISRVLPRLGMSRELFESVMAAQSPLSYPRRLDRDAVFVIGGRGDRLVPPAETVRLWHRLGAPPIHWHDGNHVLHPGQRRYSKMIAALLEDIGFADAARRAGGRLPRRVSLRRTGLRE